MKKSILIALLGMSLAACNNDDLPDIADNDAETPLMETFRSEDEAIEIATKALNEFYPVTSRSGRDLSQMNVVLLNKPASRNSDITNPLYVVNFGNESGYAIISADKETEPLLAVTESGSITSLDNVDNPGLRLFLDGASKLQKDTTALVPFPGTGGEHKVYIYRNDTVFHINRTVEPRIKVHWAQRYPEGLYCPYGSCGCVATAGAQSLSFFEYPDNISLTFPDRIANQIPLDWNNMKQIKSSATQLPLYSNYHKQLASLCREIGIQTNTTYSETGASTSIYNLWKYFKILLPSNKFSISNPSYSNPKTNIELGNGIIIIGGDTKNPDNSAHAWLIDGYKYCEYTVYVYYHELDTPYEILERQFDKTDLYSHVSWGLINGRHNGYFLNNVFEFKEENNNEYLYNHNLYCFNIKTK